VLGVGDAGPDIFLGVDRLPGPDEKVVARSVTRRPGGMVANFLVAFRRLGLTCGLNAVVGDDELGRLTLADLDASGVDRSAVVVRPGGQTFFCTVLLDPSGEKALVAAPTDCFFPSAEDVDERAIARAQHLHTTDGDVRSATRAATLARRHGLTVSVDVEGASSPDPGELRALVALADVLFVGAGGARALGETDLLRLGPRIVCTGMGAEGAVVDTKKESILIRAYGVPVVDSTGAGDCFAAGFVHGFLQGWPVGETARFASAVGAIAVTQLGGHEGAPRLDEVERFLVVAAE
jgi:ribokinase